jgi:hypothetical protein
MLPQEPYKMVNIFEGLICTLGQMLDTITSISMVKVDGDIMYRTGWVSCVAQKNNSSLKP